MTTAATYAVETAIAESIREQRIVALEARLDSQEWADLAAELFAESADSVEHGAALGELREYWGRDADGDTWRIHLRGTD